jgi:hypothetical protein
MKKPTATPKTIDDLKDAPFNPRDISVDGMRGLNYSLSEFGDLSGFTFNTALGVLLTGHQRLRVLKTRYGAEQLKIEGEWIVCPDGERYRLRLVDWDEAKSKAALLAANNTAIQGSFTQAASGLIEAVQNTAPDLWDGLLLKDIKLQIGPPEGNDETASTPAGSTSLPPEMEIKPFEHYDYVLIMFRDSRDWMNFTSRFPLEKRHFPLRNGKVKSVGDCRVLDGKIFLAKIGDPK